MAEGNERMPTTTAAEGKGKEVIVTCLVNGLKVSGLLSKTPKNATVSVKFLERGFDMTAVVKGKNGETTFRKKINKLPGPVEIDSCKWKVAEGKVIITLEKATEGSWAVQLQSGLEQQSDEEDN